MQLPRISRSGLIIRMRRRAFRLSDGDSTRWMQLAAAVVQYCHLYFAGLVGGLREFHAKVAEAVELCVEMVYLKQGVRVSRRP